MRRKTITPGQQAASELAAAGADCRARWRAALHRVCGTSPRSAVDLKPGDIAVTDSGSAVKISDLRLVTGTSSSEHLITLLFDRLEPSSAKNARDIATKILKMIPGDQFSFSVLNIEGRLRLFQEFTSDSAALAKAIGAATEVQEGINEDPAALSEKDLIAVAQTGKDASGMHVSAQRRSAARMMLASRQESQRIVQDQHCRPWLAALLALSHDPLRF